jgi:hypothetical protein
MKLTRSLLAISLSFSLVFVSFLNLSVQQVNAQDSKIALQRGYRTGYSDGYMSGYRDSIENGPRGFNRHSEFIKADRAYSKDYGTLEDYRDGYQQGFESGYNAGFEKRSFDATLPVEIKKRGTISANTPVETTVTETPAVTAPPEVKNTNPQPTTTTTAEEQTTTANTSPNSATTETVTDQTTTAAETTATPEKNDTAPTYVSVNGDQAVMIPVDAELIVEMLDEVNTSNNKEGDKFTARVVSPAELNGAIIEGRISRIQKPGRIKRRAELSLSFNQIRLSDNRWANYNAILTEVLPIKGDNIRRVDAEGTVEGKSSVKSDTVKVGASTGTGMVVGAIAGGPVGAAVGAGVGAAFGVGAAVVDRGKNVNITKGQQLRIRTVYETQIR